MESTEQFVREFNTRYPRVPIRTCQPTQQGWDSLTLLVNGDTILRFARRPDVAVRLWREARILPRLAELLPVAVPHFLYTCPDPHGGLRFVGYRMLPGEPLADTPLDSTRRERIATALGTFLSALHRFPVPEAAALGIPGGSAEEWRQEYVALFGEVRAHVLPLLTPAERPPITAFWEGYLADHAHFAFTPVLIHRDLGPEHILLDPQRGQLSGIIDWGDVSIGDPAQDFTGLYRSPGPDFARQARAAYSQPTDSTFWRRVAFFADLAPFIEILFGHGAASAEHTARGLAQLRTRFA